jgi:thiosulfate/3-mercaptopyruvate sulfurtransferase
MSWHTLVSAEQAAAQLDNPRLRIFDCRYELARPSAGHEAYLAGHLPGAVYADLHHDLAAPATARSFHSVGTPRLLFVSDFSS